MTPDPFAPLPRDLPPRLAAAIDALRAGRMVIMTDDEDRENEGDLVQAAEFVTPASVNFMATHGRGLICLALEGAQVDRLGLPPMVAHNSSPRGTAFTVSVEARHGITTGISAFDRAHSIAVAASPEAGPADLVSPGHVFPLRAAEGGVLARAGHTEGSVDLLRLAGLRPAAIICEVMSANGEMARRPELDAFGQAHGLPVVSIAELAAVLRARLAAADDVVPVAQSVLPSLFADAPFAVHAFRDGEGAEHLALVTGDPANHPDGSPPLVRLHSECVTGDVLGSLRCDCGRQLQTALSEIGRAPAGVLLYLRGHEGRGIGLANKIRAYALQDEGLDTVAANHRLGLPADARDWSVAASILRHLGVTELALLTNNPRKIAALEERGFRVRRRVALEMPATAHNGAYLRAKRDRMGHLLDGLAGATGQAAE